MIVRGKLDAKIDKDFAFHHQIVFINPADIFKLSKDMRNDPTYLIFEDEDIPQGSARPIKGIEQKMRVLESL